MRAEREIGGMGIDNHSHWLRLVNIDSSTGGGQGAQKNDDHVGEGDDDIDVLSDRLLLSFFPLSLLFVALVYWHTKHPFPCPIISEEERGEEDPLDPEKMDAKSNNINKKECALPLFFCPMGKQGNNFFFQRHEKHEMRQKNQKVLCFANDPGEISFLLPWLIKNS